MLHALQIDGRVPFSRLAKILGVSDQTIARRYRKLQSDATMRVVARLNPRPLGQTEWFVRLQSTPDIAERVAVSLARRADASWVSLASGGTEVVCVVRAQGEEAEQQTLLQKLANTPRVVSVTAHSILHTYVGGPVFWPGKASGLGEHQVAQLVSGLPPAVETERVKLSDGDLVMIAALSDDGRMSVQQLAAATGWAENTVRRRLEFLCGSGVLFFDIDIDFHLLGFNALALLWLSVRPQSFVPVAKEVAGHPEISFAAATTGSTNLLASAICQDSTHLFEYLTERIGAMDGIRQIETAPITRIIKRAITISPRS
ncbi:Lrp/AsnC family transcriptional regulator [Streptomyces platensis]|nr:Lrp/AsnC family transcriptional regulator [Streptomyces platensis]